MADAGSYVLRRLKHHTTSLDADTAQFQPLALGAFLSTAQRSSTEKAMCLGAQERVAARLVASRVPAPLVHARRRGAHKQAQQKGYTPAQAHLQLFAWNRCITHVPRTLWKTETICKVYPLRWHIERILQSWKSDLP